MLKKHLIACSGMLVLMVAAKLFIYCTPSTYTEIFFSKDNSSEKKSSINSWSFANESMPLHDPNVLMRMKKALRAYHFDNQQTKKLHIRARQYFPLVESILKKYDIPEDFKYIPLVESEFEKGTSSYRGASGYWQFMPQTARDYGLRVDSSVDERQDIEKSTVAACKYLRSIFSELKDWTLVAAAYNTGEDKLMRQIKLQNQDNYFKMKLNSETARYVYSLVAMKQIIENPAEYGYARKKNPMIFAKSNSNFTKFVANYTGDTKVREQLLY
jgi:membrane-bound lytic murein transglycosylase D